MPTENIFNFGLVSIHGHVVKKFAANLARYNTWEHHCKLGYYFHLFTSIADCLQLHYQYIGLQT
jgi:hypothetical protein